VVDDLAMNRELLTIMLETRGHEVVCAHSAQQAFVVARQQPPDLVLMDISMPDMDGVRACAELRTCPGCEDVPVIFISALSESRDKVRAFDAGGVDYIAKPFQMDEVLARVDTHLTMSRTRRHLEHRNHRLEARCAQANMATIFAMSKLAESRDDDTGKHLERVQIYCRMLAEELLGRGEFAGEIDAAFVENIYHASPLHDIGKVAIPDAILCKPGKLNEEERRTMQSHAARGATTLESVAALHPWNAFVVMGVRIARSHHERWDGNGYPDRLAGEDIPLCARIMAVADVYDALTTQRCYKAAFTHEESVSHLVAGRGSQFDARVVDAFHRLESKFEAVRAAFPG
jgi:putative two-component system response regulator